MYQAVANTGQYLTSIIFASLEVVSFCQSLPNTGKLALPKGQGSPRAKSHRHETAGRC
jgi:hypothetical protein